MLEEHRLQLPRCVEETVAKVAQALTPTGVIYKLGYRWWAPGDENNLFDGWQIAVFPTAIEFLGGPEDGHTVLAGFYLNLSEIETYFSSLEVVEWRMPACYNGFLDGPEVSLQGRVGDQRLWLRVFHRPPPDEPIACTLDVVTGKVKPKSEGG